MNPVPLPEADYQLTHVFHDKSLVQIRKEYPELIQRMKQLQVFTIMAIQRSAFDDHKIWTSEEICAVLFEQAKRIDKGMACCYSNDTLREWS
jgi:hypothetical protein